MIKKISAFIVAAALCLSLTACDSIPGLFNGPASDEEVPSLPSISSQLADNYNTKIGEVNKTVWFNYVVVSATKTQEYAGYTAPDGFELVDILLTFEDTFDDSSPMSFREFPIQWGEGEDDWSVGIEPIDDTMMPEDWTLEAGGTAEYHIVYEVPAGSTGLIFSFLEVYSDDSEGEAFLTALD